MARRLQETRPTNVIIEVAGNKDRAKRYLAHNAHGCDAGLFDVAAGHAGHVLGVTAVVEQNEIADTEVVSEEISSLNNGQDWHSRCDSRGEVAALAHRAHLVAPHTGPSSLDVPDKLVHLHTLRFRCK